jgi:alkylated DNA repair dioxygenase AlkB
MVTAAQLSLFGREEPSFDATFARVERIALDHGAWLEFARGWLSGDALLFDRLEAGVPWRAESRTMYDRVVDVPRLHAVLDGAAPQPVLARMREALGRRYATDFARTSMALYRDGQDSVAWHGDYPARKMDIDTVVATVSLGAPRTFLLRPKGGGASRAWKLGQGDLLVMGGSCQRAYEHAVPKVARAGARMAVMFRPIWEA